MFIPVASAHFKFEDNLPGGNPEKKRYLRPVDRPTLRAAALAAAPKTSLSLPLSEADYDKVEDDLLRVTGGVPRLIRRLGLKLPSTSAASTTAVATVTAAIQQLYLEELELARRGVGMLAKEHGDQVQHFILDAVARGPHPALSLPPGSVKGLVFQEHYRGGTVHLMHDAARRAVGEKLRGIILDKRNVGMVSRSQLCGVLCIVLFGAVL